MTDQPGGVSLPPQPVFDWRERLGHLVDHKSGLGDKRFGEAVVAMLYEYDALMVKARAQSLPLPPRGWQPQEVLYAFMSWLTCRPCRVTLSGSDEASVAVELIAQFSKAHDLPEPRDGWHDAIVPSSEWDDLTLGTPVLPLPPNPDRGGWQAIHQLIERWRERATAEHGATDQCNPHVTLQLGLAHHWLGDAFKDCADALEAALPPEPTWNEEAEWMNEEMTRVGIPPTRFGARFNMLMKRLEVAEAALPPVGESDPATEPALRLCARCAHAAYVGLRCLYCGRQALAATGPDTLQDALIAIYEKASENWCAQCFCFTSAPESLRRNAHEAARDGFNELVTLLGPIVRPWLEAEYKAAEAAAKANAPVGEGTTRPKIICLCGSTRFIEQFAIKTWELELEGFIVLGCTLLPLWYCECRDHFAEKLGVKGQRDEHHLRKIDLADEVLVLNIDGYIGDSTRSEIAYATATGKPVRYVEELHRGGAGTIPQTDTKTKS